MRERRQRPRLGQNFLVSATAQAAIADALGDVSARTVVEIGPGRGEITALLAARARRLVGVFRYAGDIERAVVMVQREVADRLAAVPGTRDYGVLTVTAQMVARVEKLMTLSPGEFSPPPQVHSTVVRLTMAPRFAELGVQPHGANTGRAGDPGEAEGFLRFVRSCFALGG